MDDIKDFSSLKETALLYYNGGLNVIPVRFSLKGGKWEKEFLVSLWKQWEDTRQTREEFEDLSWERAEGFAIIVGKVGEKYICPLDYDEYKLTEAQRQIVRKILQNLHPSRIESTINGGLHHLFWCLEEPKTETKYREGLGIEVLGVKRLCIMSPSKGYKLIKQDMDVPTIKNFNEFLDEVVAKVGVQTQKSKLKVELVKKKRKRSKTKVRYCIEKTLKTNNNINHLMRLAIASEYKRVGMAEEDIVNLFRNQTDFDWDKCLVQVRSADAKKVATCETIKDYGYCYEECPDRKWNPSELIEWELKKAGAVTIHPLIDFHPEIGLSIGAIIGNNSLSLQILVEKSFQFGFEEIQEEVPFSVSFSVRKPRFAYLSPKWKRIILVLSKELSSEVEIEYTPKEKVFEKVLEGIRHYWFHSDERFYILVTCWIIGTYLHQMFSFFPALCAQGERSTGKTTLLDVLRMICWNPTGKEASLREADLFRTIEGSRVTYLADITRLNPRSPNYQDVVDVLELGTEKGGQIRRIGEDGEPMFYDVYGPKAIAVRYELPFLSKLIRIITDEAKDKAYSERRSELENDSLWDEITKLLIRASVKYWKEVYEAYKNAKQTDKLTGRPFNYWSPLLAICKVFAPEKYEQLLMLAEEEAKEAEKGDFLSKVEDAVLITLSEQGKEGTFTTLLKALTESIREKMPEVKSSHIVQSAIKNLKITREKYYTAKGVTYRFDLKRVKEKLDASGLKIEREGDLSERKAEIVGASEKPAIPTNLESGKPKIIDGPFEGPCSICGTQGLIYRTNKGCMCDKCIKEFSSNPNLGVMEKEEPLDKFPFNNNVEGESPQTPKGTNLVKRETQKERKAIEDKVYEFLKRTMKPKKGDET